MTPAAPSSQFNDARAKRNVLILVMAQALLGAQMAMVFIVAGLAGQSLASNLCFATLPITAVVLGSTLTATPMSAIMQKYSRRVGFFIGTSAGATGALVGVLGLLYQNFWLFVLGGLFTGIYQSSQGFFRFAATDTASPEFRPKAISWVLAGGLASAIIGPQLVKLTSQAFVVPFLGTYMAVIAINVVGSGLFFFLDIPKPSEQSASSAPARTRLQLLKTPRIAVAIIVGMVTYALMNLVMTATPLAVVGCGFEANTAADIVSLHVLAMFAPSFFTGSLIARFGVEKIMAIGLTILAGAGVVALSGVEIEKFFIALILLGIGWNFGFIGATTMLTSAHEPSERGRVQGMNDLLVFGGVTFASLASGGLMNCSGGTPQDGWAAVNIAMIPFLTLAGAALIWLWFQSKDSKS